MYKLFASLIVAVNTLSFDYDEPYRVLVRESSNSTTNGTYPEWEQDPDYYDYSYSGYYNSYYGSYIYSYSYYSYSDENGEYHDGYSTQWEWATEDGDYYDYSYSDSWGGSEVWYDYSDYSYSGSGYYDYVYGHYYDDAYYSFYSHDYSYSHHPEEEQHYPVIEAFTQAFQALIEYLSCLARVLLAGSAEFC